MGRTPEYTTLYRKYRSQSFEDLVGQPHVTTSLANSLKLRRISHAYLFAGPRGTGKTSAARILAAEVNNLTSQDSTSHLDIIEIDAASNRRIDEIRQLRERVHSAPTAAKYKVYIVDEVHMLTTEAFNALLKTLEEPPKHAIFILATTEPHKLPETIISRTQRYNFRPIAETEIENHLKKIAKKENIKISPDAITLIATAAGGSMRDAISLLDQMHNVGGKRTLTSQMISQQLGIASNSAVLDLIQAVVNGDAKHLIALLENTISDGLDSHQFVAQIIKALHTMTRIKIGTSKPTIPQQRTLAETISQATISKLLRAFSNLHSSNTKGWLLVEAVCIELCLDQAADEPSKLSQHVAPNNVRPVKQRKASPKDQPSSSKKPKPDGNTQLNDTTWEKILTHVKNNHNSLYALLNAASPQFDKNKLILEFKFQFHLRRLQESKNLALLNSAIEEIHGSAVAVDTKLAPAQKSKAQDELSEDKSAIDGVLQIMGGEIIQD